MNYFTMRREVSQAVVVLIENREEWGFNRWFLGMVAKYGISKKMVLAMLKDHGYTVVNDKVVLSE